MLHALLVEPLGQIVRHVTRTIVAEKPWPVRDGDVVKAGYSECLVEGGCDVGSAHGGTYSATIWVGRARRSGWRVSVAAR
ncbi:hypothetical protein ACVII1_005374 [Bradyrhizobium elkanii]